MRTIAELASEIKACERCHLCKARTNTVPGEGNTRATLMFVGESPGNSEDQTGKPFVGKAGRLMNELLESAGIARETVFITSVLKCRPSRNRNPNSSEIDRCSPYLFEQIEVIGPRIICTLGNVAARALLGKSGVTKLRGKIVEKGGIIYFPTYHPAAAARNPFLKIILLKDLKKLAELAKKQ